MSKFIAKHIFKMTNELQQTIICLVIDNSNRFSAECAYKELKALPENASIEVAAKQYKSQRSLRQNSMLWALLEKMSIATTGYARKEDVEECYINLLAEANIDCKFRIILPEDKTQLEEEYRVIKKIGERTILESKTKVDVYQCWKGSSKFDTKQMSELIELALDQLATLGVMDSEIASIREEYGK